MTKVEEKYNRATRSSHLEMKRTDEGQGDVETIIAAGLAETLGILMTRLRGEWDAAQGDVLQYRRAQAEWVRMARESAERSREHTLTAERSKAQLQKARPEDRADLEKLIADSERWAKGAAADAIRYEKEVTREASTAQWEILSGLRSLDPAKQALFNFAHRQAPRKACGSTPEELGALVGRVLDVWLDRLCHPCEGRGFSGGYGKARVMCGKCGGTGSRRSAKLGENASEQAFGLWLLNVLDSRCNTSMQQVQRKTRNA